MQITIKQLDFTIAINSCHKQITNKMQYLDNIEIDLLNKYQKKISNTEIHLEMIHDVRNMILNIEEMHKDVKDYFNEIDASFIYQFFRKMHVLMVYGYNFISQALIANTQKLTLNQKQQNKIILQINKDNFINNNQKRQKNIQKNCTFTNQSQDDGKNDENQNNRTEQSSKFDYKIGILQKQEEKLSNEMEILYEKMIQQKDLIQKTKPSHVIRQLEDMKENMESVMKSANSVCEESYMLKYFEFKNSLDQIKRPEELINQFTTNMNGSMKGKFFDSMSKIISKIKYDQNKGKQKKVHIDAEIQTDRFRQRMQPRHAIRIQKNLTFPLKQKDRKGTDKAALLQFHNNQRKITQLIDDKESLKKQLKRIIQENDELEINYKTLQILYSKKSYEYEVQHTEKEWKMSEKDSELNKLKNEIKILKKDQIQTFNRAIQVGRQTNNISMGTEDQPKSYESDNQIIAILKKNNQKLIIRINDKQKKIKEYKDKIGNADIEELKKFKKLSLEFVCQLSEITITASPVKQFLTSEERLNIYPYKSQDQCFQKYRQTVSTLKQQVSRMKQRLKNNQEISSMRKKSFKFLDNQTKNSSINKIIIEERHNILDVKQSIISSLNKITKHNLNIPSISMSTLKIGEQGLQKSNLSYNEQSNYLLPAQFNNQEDNDKLRESEETNKEERKTGESKTKSIFKKNKQNSSIQKLESHKCQHLVPRNSQNSGFYAKFNCHQKSQNYSEEYDLFLFQKTNEIQTQTEVSSQHMQIYHNMFIHNFKDKSKHNKYLLNDLKENKIQNLMNLSFNQKKNGKGIRSMNNTYEKGWNQDCENQSINSKLQYLIGKKNNDSDNRTQFILNEQLKNNGSKKNQKKNQNLLTAKVSLISLNLIEKHNSFKPEQYIRQFTQSHQLDKEKKLKLVQRREYQNEMSLKVKSIIIDKKVRMKQEETDNQFIRIKSVNRKNNQKLLEIKMKNPSDRLESYSQNRAVQDQQIKLQKIISQPESKQKYQRYTRKTYSQRKRNERSS